MARRERRDIHAEITGQIIAQLRDGIRPWMRPWDPDSDGVREGAGLPLRDNEEPYSGINVLVLWSAALEKGYTKPTWMTFKQAKSHGGRVRKGEKGRTVVYADRYRKTEVNAATGEEERREVGFLKRFTVFNVEQIDGLDERWHRTYAEIHPVNREQRREGLEGFFKALGIDVRHGGDEAYYVLSDDYIQMPRYELFHDAEAYYTTLAHESIHWTRHASRLNRTFRGSYQVPYAKEELVAEIGSAFLSAELGIAPAIREDHADYIGAWLRVLEDDSRAIFRAASHATKAVTWLKDRARAMNLEIGADIDAGESLAPETQPALPLDDDPGPSLPVRGVAPGAVQGELSLRGAPAGPDAARIEALVGELRAGREARQFVDAALAWRAEGGREGARRLLDAVDRIDLTVDGVVASVEAAQVLAGGRGRKAEVFLQEIRAEARRSLAQDEMAVEEVGASRRGMSF